jgi:phenylpropionate dioxygenase-like ring-hydroxylating dioxygenase large terminal subunit
MSTERKFVENIWYAAAWEWEVAEADYKLARTICEVPLVFFKTESGSYAALDNRCCHRSAPLSLGRIEGECLRCMYHGMLFNTDGKVVQIPGQAHIAETMRVRSYPLESRGGMLWIWMGDPTLADPALIHDFAPLSQPDQWRGFDKESYLHYDANWLLIVDNLSDFSHVAFVHTTTLGGSEEYAYETKIENLEQLDNGYRTERWHRNSMPPPFHCKVIPAAEHEMKLDRCNRMAMYLPGIFLMDTIFEPVDEAGKPANDGRPVREYRNCQLMTPETYNSTHFFWNYLHCDQLDNDAISPSLKDSLMEGFMEDKVFIEAQQKLLEDSPDFVPRSFNADEALTYFRLRWNAKLKEENEKSPLPAARENKRRIL